MNANLDPLEALRAEHEEIRAVLNDLEKKLKNLAVAASDEASNNFINQLKGITAFMDKDLEIHFKREEEGLFPTLGNYIGVETGPINVMLIEHSHCRDLAESFKAKIDDYSIDKDFKSLSSAGNSLGQLLMEHEDKEDHILFNMAEMHLTPEEKSVIMEKMLNIK